MATTTTVATVNELNYLSARLRAEGFVVKVHKLEQGWELTLSEGGRPSSFQPKQTETGEEIIFFNLSEFKRGEAMAADLREQGIACKFAKAKSGRCWYLKRLA
jgi:hypothetical protein